ncbi:MAG: bacillithiol biosynthesis cysteine-adding enzyme BshC [Bergeyella sp.]
MKKITNISFQEISTIPKLIKDYLNGEIPAFREMLYTDEKLSGQIQKKKENFSSEKRKTLSEVLKQQHQSLELSEIQKKNLEKISEDNTFTVTTGHQLNLFTGPVFFIYKILQTIKLAEDFKKLQPENHFIPVFWMATEDHDFEEINHFRTETQFYEISGKSGGAVGRIVLDEVNFEEAFSQEFRDSVFGTELILMMKKAYVKGKTLSEATKILVHELFSEYGLLILDGDNALLKVEMKTIFRDELLEEKLHLFSKEKVDFLKSQYGKAQVNPRKINLFYLSETRNRIEKSRDKYIVVDTEIAFSEEEILQELENFPERFSPNALLRPVYQESVLPNLCYIGGNAEVMYWLELADYFKETGLVFPFLIPRNSMLFVSEKNLKKMEKEGLKIQDFFKDFASLTKGLLLENSQVSKVLEEKENLIKTNFLDLKNIASETDKTFGNMVSAEEARQLKSFERMKKRLLRAEKIKQSEKLERLETLFLSVHPLGNWQERIYNFSIFFQDEGKEWLRNCYQQMIAHKSELIIFSV